MEQGFFALFGKGKAMVRHLPDEADAYRLPSGDNSVFDLSSGGVERPARLPSRVVRALVPTPSRRALIRRYVCLTFSAQELPDVEELCDREEFKKPVVLFNLKLDTQRGDLGLPAFPAKDLQWRFLSRAKPVYFLRTRQYTLSLPVPPFVVNYQGAIFRQYPGPYQCLLDTGKTSWRRAEIVSTLGISARRPAAAPRRHSEYPRSAPRRTRPSEYSRGAPRGGAARPYPRVAPSPRPVLGISARHPAFATRILVSSPRGVAARPVLGIFAPRRRRDPSPTIPRPRVLAPRAPAATPPAGSGP